MAFRRAETKAKWRTMRELAEGAEPSPERLAVVSRLKPETIRERALVEGWDTSGPGTAAEMAERIARLMHKLMRELDAAEAAAGEGTLDKARMDALTARMRMLERLTEINEGRQGEQEEQARTDAEIAEILGRIDARIVELATEFAADVADNRNGAAARSAG